MKALVIFHGHGEGLLSKLLNPRFRHVFVVVRDGDRWAVIDGRAGIPNIDIFESMETEDLKEFYELQGFTVVETEQRDKPPKSPFAIANCVGMVKAVLSIRSTAITPYQLYKYLRRSR